ncbi:MAG: DUF1801 domain-containing protein [Planctomycetota bacterium]|nr:DUF1801 domain-containing protein [Planctomycetota bacterium]
MAARKTQKNHADVDKFLAGVKDEARRADCLTILELMKELSGEPAAMWGKSIIGFGKFRYRGKTGEGDWFPVGFSPRKQDLTLYLHCILEKQTALLEKLGKNKIGKSCLYIKKLEDIHIPTLEKLIKKAIQSPMVQGAETIG